ncbi:nucleoid-associated protein, YbaB/EbfC family [Candidatus Peregrinibacteria bacterium]|mgnify:CR=1 FL=1|jgi:nucleoid-associated protein EbfC|nr:nucleoid-associated protein, YbaB/EbfC family [Candidatus Peregrinibacteria bacterium]MBT4148511.1 nucleoid-associated protein, YbaB/EbfC family [Candidatus Peregrinibacteria bacterium]MBT4366708.1 nucleoid-associated protein, YbaB/EbfC family [Candidatus Peregrinibacteria bacterium]MBT4455523.1 nucleoid-associated protein, YbaB/EbfC family [Candidatus Peregrinibacteria bacterium]
MFDKAKDLYKVQKEARKIKGELKNTHIEAESEGVVVTINGEQKVMSVKISDDAIQKAVEKKAVLEESLEKAFNKGIEKSQQIGAEKMKDIMGDMNIPGLG